MMTGLLPPNSTSQERAFAAAAERISALEVPFRELMNPDTCPLPLLPWLAWSLSVDEWDSSWSDTQKRAAVKAAIKIHQRKGTIGAVKSALGALGYELEVTEWFQRVPVSQPYTFGISVTVEQQGIPGENAFDQIVLIANSAKNERSRMSGVDIKAISRGEFYLGAACFMGETVTIQAEPT